MSVKVGSAEWQELIKSFKNIKGASERQILQNALRQRGYKFKNLNDFLVDQYW